MHCIFLAWLSAVRRARPERAGELSPRFQPIGAHLIKASAVPEGQYDNSQAFVPEGQGDRSQARSAFAPKGLQDSAQGFNPGNSQNKRFALKGREMRPPDESRTYCRAKVTVRH
jgi:hypothetical protein